MSSNRRVARLDALFSLFAVILIFVQCHWALWYYFDSDFDAQKILAEVATGAVGAIYAFLPELNKRFLQWKFRELMNARATLLLFSSLAAFLFIVVLLVNRSIIKWPSVQGQIQIGDQKIQLEDWVELTTRTVSTYGYFLTRKHLQVGDFSEDISFRPFIPFHYEIPESAVFSAQSEYQEIVRLLALSFYQSTENRFLADAGLKLTSDTGKKFVDLNSVLDIIRLCFGGSDTGRSADILLSTFEKKRHESLRLPLLQACVHYAHNEFAEAEVSLATPSAAMHSPLLETAVFFRGVNQLKRFIEKSNNSGVRDLSVLGKARLAFRD